MVTGILNRCLEGPPSHYELYEEKSRRRFKTEAYVKKRFIKDFEKAVGKYSYPVHIGFRRGVRKCLAEDKKNDADEHIWKEFSKNPAPRVLFWACDWERADHDWDCLKKVLEWKCPHDCHSHLCCSAHQHILSPTGYTLGLNSKFEFIAPRTLAWQAPQRYTQAELALHRAYILKKHNKPRHFSGACRVIYTTPEGTRLDFTGRLKHFTGLTPAQSLMTHRELDTEPRFIVVDTSDAEKRTYTIPYQAERPDGTFCRTFAPEYNYQYQATALIAVVNSKVEKERLVRQLISMGADVRESNWLKQTPLHFAAERGWMASAKHIMDNYPDLDAQDCFGETALHKAVRNQNVGVVNLLLQAEADVSKQDHDSVDPLGRAVILREALDYQLLELKHNPDSGDAFENERIEENLQAAKATNEEVVELLIDAGADVMEVINKGSQYEYCIARRYFDNQPNWHRKVQQPSHDYQHPMFQQPWNQAAIQVVWKRTCRGRAICNLLWAICFLVFVMGWGLYEAVGTPVTSDQLRLFISQQTVVNLIATEDFNPQETRSFADIADFAEMWQWVNQVWIPALYSPPSYYRNFANVLTPVDDKLGGMLEFVGSPQIRQLRTDPVGCMTKSASPPAGVCYEPLSSSGIAGHGNAAQAPYGPNGVWKFDGESKVDSLYPLYMTSSDLTSKFPVGYRVVMPSNRSQAEALVQSLQADHFVDLNTRAVLFEVVVSSGKSEFATFCRMVVSSNSNGGFTATPYIKTLRIRQSFGTDTFATVWISITYLFILGYICPEIVRMTERWPKNVPQANIPTIGTIVVWPKWAERLCICRNIQIRPYWYDPFNYLDVLKIMLFVALTIIFAMQHWYCNGSGDIQFDSYLQGQPVEHIWYLATLQTYKLFLLGAILWIMWVSMLEFFQINSNFALMVRVTLLMLARIGYFIIIVVIFLLCFACFNYLLHGVSDIRYSTFMHQPRES